MKAAATKKKATAPKKKTADMKATDLPPAVKRNIFLALLKYSTMPWEWVCNGVLVADAKQLEVLGGERGVVAIGLLGLARGAKNEGGGDKQTEEYWTLLLDAMAYTINSKKFAKAALAKLAAYDVPIDVEAIGSRAGGVPGRITTTEAAVQR